MRGTEDWGRTEAAGIDEGGVALAQRADHGVAHALGHLLPGAAVAAEEHQLGALAGGRRGDVADGVHQPRQVLRAAVRRYHYVLCRQQATNSHKGQTPQPS